MGTLVLVTHKARPVADSLPAPCVVSLHPSSSGEATAKTLLAGRLGQIMWVHRLSVPSCSAGSVNPFPLLVVPRTRTDLTGSQSSRDKSPLFAEPMPGERAAAGEEQVPYF